MEPMVRASSKQTPGTCVASASDSNKALDKAGKSSRPSGAAQGHCATRVVHLLAEASVGRERPVDVGDVLPRNLLSFAPIQRSSRRLYSPARSARSPSGREHHAVAPRDLPVALGALLTERAPSRAAHSTKAPRSRRRSVGVHTAGSRPRRGPSPACSPNRTSGCPRPLS